MPLLAGETVILSMPRFVLPSRSMVCVELICEHARTAEWNATSSTLALRMRGTVPPNTLVVFKVSKSVNSKPYPTPKYQTVIRKT